MFTKRLPITIKATKAIAHCMGVFTQDQRSRFIWHANPFFNRPFWHSRMRLILLYACIHWAQNIRGGGISAPSLILNRTRWIVGFNPAIKRIMVTTMTGFISQRPDNDTRMVTVTLHHASHSLAHRIKPHRIVAQTIHRHHAMSFNIGLIHHV